MMKMSKKERIRNRLYRNEQRELERMVSKTGLKGSSRKMVEQYGRGILDGMHIASFAVVERLYRAGNSREEIMTFFQGLLNKSEIDCILEQTS